MSGKNAGPRNSLRPFARPDVRPGGESALGTAGSTFLSPISPPTGPTEPSTSVESFLTVRGLDSLANSALAYVVAGSWLAARYSSNLCGDALTCQTYFSSAPPPSRASQDGALLS